MGFPGRPQPLRLAAGNRQRRQPQPAHGLRPRRRLQDRLGGAGANDKTGELADSYFLGPPLCVNGKLYVLAEKQQELRLICLENVKEATDGHAGKPKIDFVLPLGTARDSRLQTDSLRRVNAAHLSYGEGVLVCPTNLGYVIAIDLLQNSLLWAYPYRDKADEDDNGALGMGGPGMGMAYSRQDGGRSAACRHDRAERPADRQGPPQQGWKASAPIIQDGKVVFTAPDSKSIHCVNLKDGTPAWSRPRQEGDLYLGGVVNGKVIVVGHEGRPRLQPRATARSRGSPSRPACRPASAPPATTSITCRSRRRRRRQGAGDLRRGRGPRRRRRPQQGARAGRSTRRRTGAGQPRVLRRRASCRRRTKRCRPSRRSKSRSPR